MTRNENLVPVPGVPAGKRFWLVFEAAICRTTRDNADSLRASLGSCLQSNLLKKSHSTEPCNSLPNLRIALHFIGFDALQEWVASASAALWLIVDPR